MKQITKLFLSSATLLGVAACSLGVDFKDNLEAGFYYEGQIFNGVTSETVTSFEIDISQNSKTINGTVDEDGHFTVGPVIADHDYKVTIEADGYRAFYSVITGPNSLPSSIDQRETLFYEASLFPSDIESPEVNLSFFTKDGAGARPDGTLRLTPTGSTAPSQLSLNTTTGAIFNQTWPNDADQRERTVTFTVENGEVAVEAGALIYGVAYTGTIFGSEGYAYESFSYTSGLEGDRTVNLERLDPTDLALTANSLEISNRNSRGEAVFTFNQQIEFTGGSTAGQQREIIDDAITIASPDYNDNGVLNVLVPALGDSPSNQERGSSVTIDGYTLTLSWDIDDATFETEDEDDLIESVTYNLLNEIEITLVDGREDQARTLGNLIGSNSVTVFIDGDAPANPALPLEFVQTIEDFDNNRVTFEFAEDIEFSDSTELVVQREAIDDAFSVAPITGTTNEPDGESNVLPVDVDSTVQERGTSITISGSNLIITWDGTLTDNDSDDPIDQITFGSLNSIVLRPKGNGSDTESQSLNSLISATSITLED